MHERERACVRQTDRECEREFVSVRVCLCVRDRESAQVNMRENGEVDIRENGKVHGDVDGGPLHRGPP